MCYQDIQIKDVDLWKQFRQDMDAGAVGAAQQILQNQQLSGKGMTANNMNKLTDTIVYVENLKDDEFKQEKIGVGRFIPTSLQKGKVFFLTYNT